jgi:hypothetical protein
VTFGRSREFAVDVAEHGLRTDLTPTCGPDTYPRTEREKKLYHALCEYFRRADQNLRERAKRAIYSSEG